MKDRCLLSRRSARVARWRGAWPGPTPAGCGCVRSAGHRAAMIPRSTRAAEHSGPQSPRSPARRSRPPRSVGARSSSMAISPNRIEARPRGPIQPRNNTSRMPRQDRTRASATGTIRTRVRESTAYSRTFQEIPRATTSGMSDPKTNHTAADSSVPTSLVSCSRSSATSSRPTAARGDARHERGDESVPAQGRSGEVGEHRQDQDGAPSPQHAPARPPRGHEQPCATGAEHHAHRHPEPQVLGSARSVSGTTPGRAIGRLPVWPGCGCRSVWGRSRPQRVT